jgi:hypothetical protein
MPQLFWPPPRNFDHRRAMPPQVFGYLVESGADDGRR